MKAMKNNRKDRIRFVLLPRFLQIHHSPEQIFARGNHYLLAKDYSENLNILSKSHMKYLDLQIIFAILATQNS